MKSFTLFIATFACAFLFFFGIAVGALMVLPVIANVASPLSPYHPQLPVSEDQKNATPTPEETELPPRQLYPPLADSDVVPPLDGDRIIIPAIHVSVPIVLSASLEDKDVLSVLNQGAALYPNGVAPGHLGNVFIAAHSTGEPWKGKYRFAFVHINELKPGNVLHLDYAGTRYTYRMTEQEIIVPSPDYQVVSDRPVPTLSLMACWPLWSTQKRMIIHAELVNVTKLTSTPS